MAGSKDPFEPFRVKPKSRLKDFDTDDRSFASSSHEQDVARMDQVAVEIDRLQDLLYANGTVGDPRKLLLVLQGLDTSGKDGTARSLFSRSSPLGVRVAAFKVPTEEERAHDFLWRVHAVVPRSGEVVVFNRSHYEDVLVPLVEGWIDVKERDRRLVQIRQFEQLLIDTGTRVVKCFLYVSREEQRKRLQARLDDPAKRWKFQPSDLETRRKWSPYMRAYEQALAATSTASAPWYVVPADSKTNRNLMIGQLVERTLKEMKLKPPKPKLDPSSVHID